MSLKTLEFSWAGFEPHAFGDSAMESGSPFIGEILKYGIEI
jgi:hypothetical protein